MFTITSIIVFLFIGSCSFHGTFADPYDQINNYIIERVGHVDDYSLYTEKALEYLAKENQSKSYWNRDLRKALEDFTALKELEDNDECDYRAYEIQLAIDEATKKRKHLHKEIISEEVRKVDKVIHAYFKDHIYYCWQKYPDLLNERLQMLDEKQLNRVALLINSVAEEHRPDDRKMYSDSNQIVRFALNVGTIKGMQDAGVIFNVLRRLAKNEPDVNYLSKHLDERKGKIVKPDKEVIRKHFGKYIVEPCEYFTEQLKDILVPVQYDYMMLSKKNQEIIDDLFINAVYFKMCTILIERNQNSLLNDVIKFAINKQDKNLKVNGVDKLKMDDIVKRKPKEEEKIKVVKAPTVFDFSYWFSRYKDIASKTENDPNNS